MANKIIHKHSSVIENGKAKLPSTEQLDYGELAVNYADGVETITIKNTANEIVEFKSNEHYNKEISNLNGEIDALQTQVGNKASNTHSHGKITLTGDVTGSATIGSGTTAVNITTTVANNSHTHTSSNISDSVASGVTSGTTALAQGRAIVDYAAPKAHTHVSAGITDSISAASGVTSGATALTQGKAVYDYAAPKTHNHGTITLTGDVTGSGTITGTNEIKITATVANDSHTHSNYTTNTNFNAHTATTATSGATGHVKLVTGNLNGKTYTNGEAAAAAHTHGQYATTSNFNSHSGATATSGATGHAKLVTGDLNGKAYANGEAAAAAHTHSNYSVTGHKHVSADITDSISAASGITSGATALTQGKAIYNYAAPKSHSHSNYSVTGHTHSQYATNENLTAATTRISKLEGNDAGKSVRTVAAEEVAKVVASAPESYDTLKEIADWITSDTTGAASMATDITELKGTVSGFTSSATIKQTTDALTTAVNGKAASTHSHGKITLSGDVTGSATIGSGTTAINITTTVANNSHTHTSANISNSVASGVTSGTTALAQGRAIVDYAAPKAHTHVSAGITDSVASGVTSGTTALAQGRAIVDYAAPKAHNHGTITLTGDVTGSGTITGTNEIKITATVANDSHTHSNYTTNTNFNAHTATTAASGATGHTKLVTGDLNGKTYVNGEAAAAAHTHSQYASASNFNSHSGTTGASGTTGHVKLVTGDLNGKTYVNGEAAAAAHTHSNYSVTGHKHVSTDITDSVASGVTSGTTALAQGRAIVDYAAPKSHSHSEYSVTGHTHSQYTTNTNFNAHTATTAASGATGHVKLVTGNLNGKTYTNGEAAAAAHTHGQYATTSNFNSHSGTTATSGATGHTKLVTGDLNGKTYVNGEAAAAAHTHSNYSVTGHKHVSADITDSISAASGITSGATALTQGKAIYNYAAPKSHSHSNYSVTGHTHSQYTTNTNFNAHTATTAASGATGHTKLVTGDLNGKTYVNGEAAAAAHTHGQYASASNFNSHSGTTATSGATGHTKLVTGDLNGKTYVNGEAAAAAHTHSNYSVTGHKHISADITDSISAASGITSTASGLTQGKAIYNYAAKKNHASTATTYGVATTANYGHVKIHNGDVSTVASANGLAAGMDHTHSDYATAANLSAATTRITTIEGDDAGKSMKEVAAREVKVLEDMLYGSGATTAIETLKDVIDWIADENSGAADMIADITELKGTVSGFTSTNTVKKTTDALSTTVNGKAPKNHASTATTYGVATTDNYGHVKISNGVVEDVASANGLAAGMDHSHKKIGTSNVGSSTQPIYLSGGTPTACTYTLAKSVPSSAVFTDTMNTAGSTNSTSKLYLIGAASQGSSAQTYSNSKLFTIDGNLTFQVNNTDKFINWDYDGDGSAQFSWRAGVMGTGSGDANYFTIDSGTSTTDASTWNQVLRLGLDTFDASFLGNILPRTTDTKNLGSSTLKWKNAYATTFHGALDGNATSATLASTVAVGSGSSDAYRPIVVHNGNALYSAGTATGKPRYNYTTGDIKAKSFTTDGGVFTGNLTGTASNASNASKLSDWSRTDIQVNTNSNAHILFDTTPMIINGVSLGDNCTLVTAPDNNAPFKKVWLSTGTTSWYSPSDKFIYVTPGDTICVESWIMRKSGATGTAGTYYLGLQFRDKNGNNVNSNAGTVYMSSASNWTCPADGVWYRRFNEYTIPKSHTAYNGSDGGSYYTAQIRLLINHSGGTIPTYFGGFRIYKRIMAKTDETGGIKVAGTRSSAITTTQGGTTSTRYYGVEIDSTGKAFVNVPWSNTTYSAATTSAAGLMSAADKSKLDGIAAGANNYTHPTDGANTGSFGPSANATPSHGGTFSVPYLTINNKGHVTAASTKTITLPTYSAATTGATGLMSAADKSKLDGIAAGANKYTLPTAATGATGGIKIAKDNSSYAVTTATSSISADVTSGKYYGVEIDKNDKAFVYVPWTDTNTDTKNTAGSTNSASKLYLVGATSQAANSQTYSHSNVYATNGVLTATKFNGPLGGVSLSDVNLGYSDLNFKFYNNITGCDSTVSTDGNRYAGTANSYGFPVSNNANAMLWIGAHSGNYGHQLGLSSNGRIYARYISNGSFPTTVNGGSWNKLAYTSDIPSVTAATTAEIEGLF